MGNRQRFLKLFRWLDCTWCESIGRSFEIVGVDNIEKLEQDFFSTLRSTKFNVPLHATAHRYEIDGKKVIALYQPSSEVKPVYFAKNVAKNLTERQQQIIALISDNPQTTRAEIAASIGVATKTVERELASMSGIVRYTGSKKGGYWEIQANEN